MLDAQFEIHLIRRNIVSTGQSVRTFEKLCSDLIYPLELIFSSKRR